MEDDRHNRDLEVSSVAVTILELEPPQLERQPEPPRPATGRTVLRLKVGLAAAIAVAVALAGALYVVQYRSAEERLVEEAVAAYTTAWNNHDAGAVRAAMADNGTFSTTDGLDRPPLFAAYVGPELDRVLAELFAAGAKLETTSEVLIADDNPARASVAQRFRYTVYGVPVAEDGISQFTLTKGRHGELLIAQHIFWRPWAARSPSMLWILDN